MEYLTREQFHAIAPNGGVVPVFREVSADLETPVSVYLKLRGQGPGFLLESVEQAEQIGRYSMLGVNPSRQLLVSDRELTIVGSQGVEATRDLGDDDPLDVIAEALQRYRPVAPVHEVTRSLPRFFGGAVGYLGYDTVRFFETLPNTARDQLGLPNVHMLLTDSLVIFDHLRHRVLLFANVCLPTEASRETRDAIYDRAVRRLNAQEQRIRGPLPSFPEPPGRSGQEFVSNMTQTEFEAAVRQAKEYIAAGDIFQVVLSQRLSRRTQADPFSIYRVLRRLNPSPYMFFLELGGEPGTCLIGSSPEMLTRLEGRRAEVRPIAGTRPRGDDEAEDRALAEELLADPKERAEHVMLVDLGRNDLGRVSTYGSVTVPDFLTVERYSHVIHLVSRVQAELRPNLDAYDLTRATFPAGTVSGAPKIRAMEIIEELEGVRRGPYAGAVGYFGFNGNMDLCITIRTILMQGDTAYLQAGAGIVADSDPTREWEETLHKARALGVAIDQAEQGI